MSDTVFYAELPWPEAEARIAAGAPVFLPLGATEQHGRHMALNVDVVIPTAVAARAAAEVGGLVLPTISWANTPAARPWAAALPSQSFRSASVLLGPLVM